MNPVKKHQRNLIAERTNGNHIPALSLPSPMAEMMPAVESLLMRETAHAPLAELSGYQAARHLAAPAFRLPAFFGTELQEGIWAPPVNVQENDQEMIVEAYLPGVNKGDIQVEIRNGSTLVIRGERKLQRRETDEQGSYLRQEFSFRKFFRSFALPLEIEPEGVASHYRDGILEVCLQKKSEVKQKTYRVSTVG